MTQRRTVVPKRKPGGGAAGPLFLFCAAIAAAATAFDFNLGGGADFWIGAEPGGTAALGAGAAALAVLAGHALRLLLGRPHNKEGRDAGADA
jgi:hypothetical protein